MRSRCAVGWTLVKQSWWTDHCPRPQGINTVMGAAMDNFNVTSKSPRSINPYLLIYVKWRRSHARHLTQPRPSQGHTISWEWMCVGLSNLSKVSILRDILLFGCCRMRKLGAADTGVLFNIWRRANSEGSVPARVFPVALEQWPYGDIFPMQWELVWVIPAMSFGLKTNE